MNSKTIIKIIFISLCFILCNLGMAEAFTKNQTSYSIERAWFDDNNIYVYYKKKISKIKWSIPNNTEGIVSDEKAAYFIGKYDRLSIKKNKIWLFRVSSG